MKKKINIIRVFMMLFMIMSFTVHQFQSSLTKVDYIEGSKTLKFTTKVSTEQMANVLKINSGAANFKGEVEKYISRNFSVSVNGEHKSLNINNSQVNGETVFIYFEVSNVQNISTLSIRNSILTEAYPKQMNLVNIAYKGTQKNMVLQKGKESSEVSF